MKRKGSQTESIDNVQTNHKSSKCNEILDAAKTNTELIEEIRQLKTQNEQFRKALDAVSSCVCITEEDGNVIFMNKRCKELLHSNEHVHPNGTEIQKGS